MRTTANVLRSKAARRLFAASLLLGTFLAVDLAWAMVGQWAERPLGPTLAVQYPAPTSPALEQASPLAAVPAEAEPPPVATPPSNEAAQPKPLCGGPPSLVILAVGSDNRPGQRIGRADVIRAVRVDFVDPGITVLAFPRDLWVALPGLEDRGIRKGRINTAYFYGDLYQLPGQGPSLLAQTLYTNFGLTVDRYAALTMSTFERSIDALGGVDVYLERPVDGSIQGLPFFNAGWHHMQGAQAVQFARIRYPDTDFHRINRQTLVLSALRTRALEPENWARLPGLVRLFLNDTRTDLSRAEIASLICLLPKVAPEDIVSLSVERGMVTSWRTDHGAQVLLPHEEDIRELVATFLSGEVPAGP